MVLVEDSHCCFGNYIFDNGGGCGWDEYGKEFRVDEVQELGQDM